MWGKYWFLLLFQNTEGQDNINVTKNITMELTKFILHKRHTLFLDNALPKLFVTLF